MWISFFLNAALIVAAGTQLTKNAEKIARGLNLSNAWAGAILLPLATSLPELVTGGRAVMIESPDLAAGNLYGSVLFNLLLIALIDMVHGPLPLNRMRYGRGLIITGLFSIIVISMSIMGILAVFPLELGWVGIDSSLIVVVYFLGTVMILHLEGEHRNGKGPSSKRTAGGEMLRAGATFFLSALVIVFAGINLTDAADAIARETGLTETLVGSLFIAISTSLPETVTTMSAVKLGFVEMAVANVFGANFFNILLFFIMDLIHLQGPLLADISPSNIITAVMGILLTGTAVVGLLYPFRRQILRMGSPSLVIIIFYFLTIVFHI